MAIREIPSRKCWIAAAFLALQACGPAAEPQPQPQPHGKGSEPIATVRQALVSTLVDDSASPVHVQIKICETDTPDEHPSIDCTVDSGYTVFGGGAYAEYTGPGALLTTTMPLDDGRTWRAESKDHEMVDSHLLTAYAIGLRLDGVNAATLRNQIWHVAITVPPVPGGSSIPSGSIGWGPMGIGGGASTMTSGSGQLLTRTWGIGTAWEMESRDSIVPSPGWVTGYTTTLDCNGIVEGFGAIGVGHVTSSGSLTGPGVQTDTGTVSTGWALAALGGVAITGSGEAGRMLFRIGVDGNPRSIIVQSKDHGVSSTGQTIAMWTQVRKTPGSHGMCSMGTALATSMDTCVATICAPQTDPFCCNNMWDSICVMEVTSICGRSCANDTCSVPMYNPSLWNDGGVVQTNNDSYNYATNHRTDTNAEPGKSSGEYCSDPSTGCMTAAAIANYATNDGLIPATIRSGCSDNRDMLALAVSPGTAYHWYRRDLDGHWSHKMPGMPATNLDNSGNIISDVEMADRGAFTDFGGYFCACSSSTEGQGHSVIE
jgi:hypothetical protein